MNDTTKQSGFSLIEAMVSLLVISVGMIGMAALYGQGLSAGRTALTRTIAVNLVADMADRIRVNRLGGAAYGGAPADNDCDPGGGVCTPAEMAAHDLFVWQQAVTAALGEGADSSVTFVADPGGADTYTIRVTWSEPGLPAAEHEVVIRVPNI